MISGLTDQRSDNGHILWHCQTVPAVRAALCVLSGPAHPGPNHCSVEAGLRKSYCVATKSVCSVMRPQVLQQRKFHRRGNVSQPQKSQLLRPSESNQKAELTDRSEQAPCSRKTSGSIFFPDSCFSQEKKTKIITSTGRFSKLESKGAGRERGNVLFKIQVPMYSPDVGC